MPGCILQASAVVCTGRLGSRLWILQLLMLHDTRTPDTCRINTVSIVKTSRTQEMHSQPYKRADTTSGGMSTKGGMLPCTPGKYALLPAVFVCLSLIVHQLVCCGTVVILRLHTRFRLLLLGLHTSPLQS